MKAAYFFILSLIYCLAAPLAFAQNKASITLPKYYQASCKNYTGTWQGFITDPSSLFSRGGPWPMTVYLYYKDGRIIGRTSAVKYAGGQVASRQLWMQCSNGQLKNIFWGNKNTCGGISQQGLLVSKNVLVMQFNWESAMAGTNFLAFLQRKSNAYPLPLPKNPHDFILGAVKSCH